MKPAVFFVVIAAVCFAVVVLVSREQEGPNELLDPNLGNSGSGLDFGLSIPKPTLAEDDLKELEEFEQNSKILRRRIRKLEARLTGIRRPVAEFRIAVAGKKGVPGKPGLQGPRGLPGPQGGVGSVGTIGAPGPQGPSGAQGLQGPSGPPGLNGLRGPPGANGVRGNRGERGDTGPRGPRGAPGRQGARGAPGIPGIRGDLGPRGERGLRGKDGVRGPIGFPPLEPGTVTGKIVNVMNGVALSGVILKILRGDRVVQNVVVSRDGSYSVRLDPGEYILQGESSGFIRFRRTITVSSGVTTTARVFMSPTLQTGQLRVVLTWNRAISDLDLHLDTPSGCKVAWNSRVCNSATQAADLDHDDTDGEGPETISMQRLMPGTYKVWVHRYSSGNFLNSEATVRVFYPSGEIRVFHIGQDGTIAGGNTWEVVTIDGATGNIFGPLAEGTKWVVVPGTPATFSSVSTSQSGLNVWAASDNNVFRRNGITDANKMGTGWVPVQGANAIGIAASDLGVWVWDEAGVINAREGVSATNPTGIAWLRVPNPDGALYTVSFDGANAVATTTDGRVWWRAGIVPSNPIGTRWFEVPGRMTFVSVYGSTLWGVRHGKIYRRLNMQRSPPAGTGWEEVPGMAARVAVSNQAVWTATAEGLVFYRKGISPNEQGGESWGQVEDATMRIKVVSVGNGVVWGLDTSDSPVFRDGVARSG